VTALLLSCGKALNDPALSEVALARLKIIEGVANQIKSKLALPEGEEVVATVEFEFHPVPLKVVADF
jgi:hypothetical protein